MSVWPPALIFWPLPGIRYSLCQVGAKQLTSVPAAAQEMNYETQAITFVPQVRSDSVWLSPELPTSPTPET